MMNDKGDKSVHSAEGRQRVGRSTRDTVFGILGCLVGGLLLIRVILMIPTMFGGANSAEVGYSLGGVTVLGIISIAILRWGIKKFQTVSLFEAVVMLKHEELGKRRWAAKGLSRVGWTPTNDKEKLDYLTASEKWDDLSALGPEGVSRICQGLTMKGVFIPLMLKALSKSKDRSAVKPLIDFLGHGNSSMYRGDIVKILREITGKDFGKHHNAWLNWYQSEGAESFDIKF